jgi:hypothetical protein
MKTPYNIKGKGPYRIRQYHPFAFVQASFLYLLDGYDFPAIVGAAGQAGMMGLLDFLALRANREVRGFEELVGASFIPAGFRVSVFWVCHDRVMLLYYFFSKSFNAENAPKSPGAFR